MSTLGACRIRCRPPMLRTLEHNRIGILTPANAAASALSSESTTAASEDRVACTAARARAYWPAADEACRILRHPERECSVQRDVHRRLRGSSSRVSRIGRPCVRPNANSVSQPLLGGSTAGRRKDPAEVARMRRDVAGIAANGIYGNPQSSRASCYREDGVLEARRRCVEAPASVSTYRDCAAGGRLRRQ